MDDRGTGGQMLGMEVGGGGVVGLCLEVYAGLGADMCQVLEGSGCLYVAHMRLC